MIEIKVVGTINSELGRLSYEFVSGNEVLIQSSKINANLIFKKKWDISLPPDCTRKLNQVEEKLIKIWTEFVTADLIFRAERHAIFQRILTTQAEINGLDEKAATLRYAINQYRKFDKVLSQLSSKKPLAATDDVLTMLIQQNIMVTQTQKNMLE